MVRDKTTLERELLRKAHSELQRKMNRHSDLSISYTNGVPTVIKGGPKNMNSRGGRNHRPNSIQLLH